MKLNTSGCVLIPGQAVINREYPQTGQSVTLRKFTPKYVLKIQAFWNSPVC